MIGADFFLSVVAGVVSGSILSRLKGRDSLAGVVRESLERAVHAHEELLRKHTRHLHGRTPNPRPRVDVDAFKRVWAAEFNWDANDLAAAVSDLRQVIVMPGCPLAPDDLANLLSIVLDTAKREFFSLLPGRPHAKSEWDVAHAVTVEDKLDTILTMLSDISGRSDAAHDAFGEDARPAPIPAPTEAAAPVLSLSKLPVTGPDLFGRDRELALLDEAWEDPHTNIVAFIAFGGIGKSAIVDHWLRQMEKDDFRGARRVFGWSFYSQGTSERTVSADQFIHSALTFFGDPKPSEGSPWHRGQRLAHLIGQQPSLLILDGLDPLQWGPGPQEGEFKDRAGSMYPLLRELSHGMDGLCILSSRVDLTDLSPSEVVWETRPRGDTARVLRVNLERLTAEAGRALLKHYGVKGLDSELAAAVEEYDGHALALCLLAEYLVEFLDGDIAKRDLVPPLQQETRQGRHAFRVMEAYDIALKREGREPERAILRVIGLFDRPASKDCFNALRREPAIEGITDSLPGLSDLDWRHAVGRLRRWRLLSPARGEHDGSLDAHRLVRDYFGQKLEHESPKGFCQAHERLYQHLRDTTKQLPDTLEEMQPLFQAVHHGCKAQRHREAFADIYRKRTHRGGLYYSVFTLGAAAADLSALSAFFETPWDRPVSSLTPRQRGDILGQVGFDLTFLGRLLEAEAPLVESLRVLRDAHDLAEAARAAENLANLAIARGDLGKATQRAQQAYSLAQATPDSADAPLFAARLAQTYHLKGELSRALAQFGRAESAIRKRSPSYPLLWGPAGLAYGSLLDELGNPEEAERQARTILNWTHRTSAERRVEVALERLVIGRAIYHQALRAGRKPATQEGYCHLETAVDELRAHDLRYEWPAALLARAAFHRDFGERDQAERDLNEALDLSTRIGLRLHETDARLLQGHMPLDEDPPDLDTADAALGRAAELVTETGYHLRDADLLILEGRLLAKQGDKDAGRAKLEEAVRVARREEAEGCVYQLAVDQAERYLQETEEQ